MLLRARWRSLLALRGTSLASDWRLLASSAAGDWRRRSGTVLHVGCDVPPGTWREMGDAMATVEQCRQALESIAKRMSADPQAAKRVGLDRSLACHIRDLNAYF